MKALWLSLLQRIDARSLRERVMLLVVALAAVVALADTLFIDAARRAHGTDQPPVDVSGNPLAGLGGYRVQVTVASDSLAGVPGCRITVVASGEGARSELAGFRAED